MDKTQLHIKNMVCDRCIMVIKSELEALGIQVFHIELGYAQVSMPNNISQETIASRLNVIGFELLLDKGTILIEQTKLAAIDYLQIPTTEKQVKTLSKFIALRIGKNYNYVSKLFSKIEGRTIEQYYIHLRIEKAKELIDYDELSLGQIATKLGYGSVHYLSSQFRKVTGVSITGFKKGNVGKGNLPLRRPVDKV